MLTRNFKILLFTVSLFYSTNGEENLETYCNINGKKALQYVSEKFLSISIDPAVLLAGLNLSDTSLRLAQHLSPAYIRIAGPSTKFVKYVDNEDKFGDHLSEDGNNVVVTPSMWFGINEWLSLANLTPVFGINDVETTRGVWNPKSTLPLLEISDKLNVTCYWQLGFDSSQKSELQYKQDLNIFSLVLEAFPERNETWKIIGSDISNIQQDHTENVMVELQDIVTAVMWEPQVVTENSFPEKDMSWKILHQQHKPAAKIWTTVPKSTEPVSFSSTMLWAIQIGEAARVGYDVIFRQPRMHEMFSDTPVYWFSLLHKKLMGSNVLDARTTVHHPGSSVYAHCTRKQNSFVRRGAITVMIVNSNTESYKIKVKLGTSSTEKTMEVLSYILTSPGENSTDILLNEKRLTPDLLSEKNPFEPKLRRAKSKSHISMEVPPISIGFFVLPGARIPVCINEEKEINFLLEEIAEDQNLPLSEEMVLKFGSRSSFVNNPTLEEIAQRMKKEMQSDEKFYNNDQMLNFKLNTLKQRIQDDPAEDKINQRGRKFFIERAKFTDRQKKHRDVERRKDELKKFLSEKAKASDSYKHETKIESKSKHLELTSDEVEKILKDRAKARAAQRNIIFTDEELDALMQKASRKFLKHKFRRSVPTEKRQKRDINMQLLDRQIYFTPTSADHSVKDYHGEIPRASKHLSKHKRDLNMKLLDYRAKLEDNRQRLEDKKYEILGNTKNIKENIKDRIKRLKHNKRYRRDINMELLKTKSEGQKTKSLKEAEKKSKPRSMFKDKEEKEATIRKPGQTSEEFVKEESQSVEQEKPINIEVYAELAVPEEDGEEDGLDFFKTNTKPNKHNTSDKRIKNNRFDDVHPKSKKSKQGKKKSSDDIQFLTASTEFTDIEEDLPCIHEYFGPSVTKNNTKNKDIIHELGEIHYSERKSKKKKSGNRKMTELADTGTSEGGDVMEYLRRKRNVEKSTEYLENDRIETDGDGYSEAKFKKRKTDLRLEANSNIFSVEHDQTAEDSNLRMATSYENRINEKKINDLVGNILLGGELVKHARIPEVIQEHAGILEVEPWSFGKNSIKNTIKRNQVKLADFVTPNEYKKTVRNSQTQLELPEDYKIYTKDPYFGKCFCSENLEMIELANKLSKATENIKAARHKRDVNDSYEDALSGEFKTFLKKSKKRKSSKRKMIHEEDAFDALRKKRDLDQETEDKSMEQINAYKKEMKQQLKEKHTVVKDKLKFKDEKLKNKLQLLDIKKEQEGKCTENNKDDILGEICDTDNEKKDPILEQLQILKRKVEHKKEELDKFLIKDVTLHGKLKEEKRGMLKDILHEGKPNEMNENLESKAIEFKDMSTSTNKNLEKTVIHEPNLRRTLEEGAGFVNKHKGNQSSSTVRLMKRSIVNPTCDVFGNYRPLTTNLKTWKPADILSLKRDVNFLKSQKLKPMSDYRILKNNDYFKLRKRRSIDSSMSDFENQIDGFMNEIEKDNTFLSPKMITEKHDYILGLPNKDTFKNEHGEMLISENKLKTEDNKLKKADSTEVLNSDTTEKADSTIDSIIFYTFNDDFGKEIESDMDTTESANIVTSRISDNIQLPGKYEQRIFQKFISDVTGFFANIGKQLESYIKHIGFN